MKRLVLAVMLTVGTVASAAQNIYDAAANARISGKPIFFVFMSEHCPHCRQYMQTLASPEVSAVLANDFEFALSVYERGGVVPSDLPRPSGTPTTYIMNSDAQLMTAPKSGAIGEANLYRLLLNIKRAHDKGLQ